MCGKVCTCEITIVNGDKLKIIDLECPACWSESSRWQPMPDSPLDDILELEGY